MIRVALTLRYRQGQLAFAKRRKEVSLGLFQFPLLRRSRATTLRGINQLPRSFQAQLKGVLPPDGHFHSSRCPIRAAPVFGIHAIAVYQSDGFSYKPRQKA